MAFWMLHAAVASALLAGAAWLLERGLRLWRFPTRAVWAAAMLAALLLPSLALLPSSGATRAATLLPIHVTPLERGMARVEHALRRVEALHAARLADPVVGVIWLLGSLGVAGSVARSASRVAALGERWLEMEVAGERVLVSHSTGPAVVGVRRPRIVVPDWVRDLDEPLGRLIVAHEREHVRARDPWLLAAGLLALVLEPWNPALWLLLARLRFAVEVDCDRRVLRARPNVHRYARLLIAVCQRTHSPLPALSPTLAEGASPLARRIAVMTATVPRHRHLRAALVAVGSLALLAVACNLPGRGDASDADASARAARGVAAAASDSQVYFEFKVEKPAVQAPGSSGPRYPEPERSTGVEGDVVVQFVVDTTGVMVPGSFKVLRASAQSFADAVRDALPSMRFVPAETKGHKVKQLVQQPFTFQIAR
jgi:TonB family protein